MDKETPGIFWIHIKKSAGESCRKILGEYGLYREVDRVNAPPNFLQVPKSQQNEVLNNYRVVLGDYQFRRCLFAKKYLFHENWDKMLKFGFSREPIDRCLSQFFYLYYRPGFKQTFRHIIRAKTIIFPEGRVNYEFDSFLDLIAACRNSKSNFGPATLSFQTHTSAMYPDVTDGNDEIMLDYVFRSENISTSIRLILDKLGIKSTGIENSSLVNKSNRLDNLIRLTDERKKKIIHLFEKDLDIYENAFIDFNN